MAVQIKTKAKAGTKGKAKAAAKPQNMVKAEAVITEHEDDLVKFFEVKEDYSRLEKVYKSVAGEVSVLFADTPEHAVTIKGENYAFPLAPVRSSNEMVDSKGIFDALEAHQEGLGFALMKFSVTDLKKYLPADVYNHFVTSVRKGNRTIKGYVPL